MQIHQLRYFEAVAQARNFTRAAEAVHIAQPSLSTQIRKLEAELGSPLFSRARNNITLTPAGEALLPHARRILADIDSAILEVQELVRLGRGRLRIGATPSLTTVLLPSVIQRFADSYPNIELRIESTGSRDLVHLLANGELDFALIILPLHARDPALVTTPLLSEPLTVAARHDDATPDELDVADLADHRLVMFPDGYDIRDVVLAECRRAGVTPTFATEGGGMDAVLGFVEAGIGIAVVPSMVLDRHRDLRAVRLRNPELRRTVAIARRRDVPRTNAATEFLRLLDEQLATARRNGSLPEGVELH